MQVWLSRMRYDVLVIGAGVSGMTSALLLAGQGFSVGIAEASEHTAPTIRGFRRNGVYFDTGFHYTGLLGKEELLGVLLQRLGVWERITGVPLRDDEGDRLQCTDPAFSLCFKHDWDANKAMLQEAFPKEHAGIETYFQAVKTLWERVPWAVLRGQQGPLEQANEAGLQNLLAFLRLHIQEPRLIAALCSHGLLYGTPPENTSLLYHSMVAGSYYGQTYQIAGGGSALAEAYDSALSRAGVNVHTGCRATAITLSSEGKVSGVKLDGGEPWIEADTCLFSGDPRLLLDLMPEGVFRPVYRHRLRGSRDTMSAFVLFGLLAEGQTFPGGNLVLLEDLSPGIGCMQRPLYRRPFFVIQSRALEGQSGISVICPMGFGEAAAWDASCSGKDRRSYQAWKKDTAETLCARLKYRGGSVFEGFRALDAATPLTFRRYCGSIAGALYGIQHRAGDMPFLPRTRVPGLYLTGQGTLATGVLGAVMSGYVSSNDILAHISHGERSLWMDGE